MKIEIFVTEIKTGETEEITDLYWFEENYVHSFEDDRFDFEIRVKKDEHK